jgi:hypothetical protein
MKDALHTCPTPESSCKAIACAIVCDEFCSCLPTRALLIRHVENPTTKGFAMKKLGLIALFWLAVCTVSAQTLSPGVAIDAMNAHRDLSTGVTTINARVTNSTKKPMTGLSVTFTLYDAENRQIGTAQDQIGELAPGAVWPVAAKTPLDFARFTAMEIVAH